MSKQYAERNPIELDKAGGYYIRHVSAMTGEKLHAKSAIAEELGYRDMVIDELAACLQELVDVNEDDCRLDHHGLCQAHYLDEVSNGGCRVANAKAVIAKAKGEV